MSAKALKLTDVENMMADLVGLADSEIDPALLPHPLVVASPPGRPPPSAHAPPRAAAAELSPRSHVDAAVHKVGERLLLVSLPPRLLLDEPLQLYSFFVFLQEIIQVKKEKLL